MAKTPHEDSHEDSTVTGHDPGGGESVETTIDRLVDRVLASTGPNRVALLLQLSAQLATVAVDLLLASLKSQQVVLRAAAVGACRGRVDPRVIGALAALRNDISDEVRAQLAEILGSYPAGTLDSSLEVLLVDREAQVRRQATVSAASRGQFVDILKRRIGEDTDWLVRQSLAHALRSYPPAEVVATLIRCAANDDDGDVRQEAFGSLESHLQRQKDDTGWPLPPASTLLAASTELKRFGSEHFPFVDRWLARCSAGAVDVAKLTSYGTDLTKLATEGRLPRAYLTDSVCQLIERTITGSGNRSIVLLGRSGCGKTAVVNELTHRLRSRSGESWCVLRVSPADLMVGTRYLGEWETRVRDLVEAIRAPRRVVLHVTNLHELSSIGKAHNSDHNAASLLAPYIEDGSIVIVGESTAENFERRFGGASGLRRLFQPIVLPDATAEQARSILEQVRDERLAEVPEDVLDRMLELATYYLPGLAMPGPAVGLLRALLDQRAATLETPLTVSEILQELSTTTGIPTRLLDDSLAIDLREVRSFFEQRVMGQGEAIAAMVDLVTLVKAGLTDPTKPFGVFLFVGPTGVGKTELARGLAEFLFGDPNRLLRFDMSEFASYEGFERLIGRTGSSGVLTRAVQERPFSVVLLDEIEKAHGNVFDLCLQLFDVGRLTDGRGQVVDFRRTTIILTSNVGAKHEDGSRVGFLPPLSTARDANDSTDRELARAFRPEFLNRLDRILYFRPLTREVAERIARREIQRVLRRSGIERRGLSVDVDPAVVSLVLTQGYSAHFGARPLKRAVERLILLPLGQSIATGKPLARSVLRLVASDQRVRVQVVPPETQENGGASVQAGSDLGELHDRLTRLDAELESLTHGLEPFDRRRKELLETAAQPRFWSDGAAARDVMGEIHRLEKLVRSVGGLAQSVAGVMAQLGQGQDREALVGIAERIDGMEAETAQLGYLLHCDGVQDLGDALVWLTAVGTEGSDVDALVRLGEMYRAFAKRRYLDCEALAEAPATDDQDESLVLSVTGQGAYALLKGEAGIHKLVRKTHAPGGAEQFDRAIVRVEVFAVPREAPKFDPSLVQISVKSRKPKPGKLMERTDLEIRLFHRPTFTAIQALTRGPHAEAVARMEQLLHGRVLAHHAGRSLDETPLVRRYHLGVSPRVKDYRSGRSTTRLERVLEGHLDPFLSVQPRWPGAGVTRESEPERESQPESTPPTPA